MPAASAEAICNMALARAGVSKTLNNMVVETSVEARMCNTFYAQCRDQLLGMYRWPFAIKRQQLNNYTGAQWSAATAYAAGQYVTYGSSVYLAVAGNTNVEPDTASAIGTNTTPWLQVSRDGWGFTAPLAQVPDFLEAISLYSLPTTNNALPTPNLPQSGYSPLRTPRNEERVAFAIEDATDGTDGRLLCSDVASPVLVYVSQVTNTLAMPPLFISALAWLIARELAGPLRADPGLAKTCNEAFMAALGEAASAEQRGQQEDPEPISEFEAAREGGYGRGDTGWSNWGR